LLRSRYRWIPALPLALCAGVPEQRINGLTGDLVIRWSDGETSMYTDTLADRLGTEHMLVAPTS
jgi:hypothetical protein